MAEQMRVQRLRNADHLPVALMCIEENVCPVGFLSESQNFDELVGQAACWRYERRLRIVS